MKKLFIPCLALLFIYTSSGCSSSGKLNYVGSRIARYLYLQYAVDGTGKSYVDLKDGQRIYGDVVDIGGNGFKTKIIVNGVKYNLDQVHGLQRGNKIYYTVFNKELFGTFVKDGKVRVLQRDMSMRAGNVNISGYRLFYAKNGKLFPLESIKELRDAIGDCPATQSVNNFTADEMKKKFEENRRFLNELFEKYNKECK